MAKDLLLGRSKRNWSRDLRATSVGQFPHMSESRSRELAQDVLAYTEVADLAKKVEAGFQHNFQTNLRLHAQGKLPSAERRSLGQLMRKWYDWKKSRDGKLDGTDFIELQNFQLANQRWTERLAELDRLPAPSPAQALAPAPSPVLKLSLLNLAVGVAGLYGMSRLVKMGRTKSIFDTSFSKV